MAYWKRSVLNSKQRFEIEEKIKTFKQTTGSELVVAISKASSAYATARLRFAITFMFVVSLILVNIPHLLPLSNTNLMLELQLMTFSLALAISGPLWPLKRLFMRPHEVQRAVKNRGRELFHSLGLTQLNPRTGTLIYLSVDEKMIELSIDDSLKTKIHRQDVKILRELMNKELEKASYYKGLDAALDVLKEKYQHFFPQGISENRTAQLSHHIIWPHHQ